MKKLLKYIASLITIGLIGVYHPPKSFAEDNLNRIIFNWESLDEKEIYSKQKIESIESLILEAASQYSSTKYVERPIDFFRDKNLVFVYFNEEIGSGSHLPIRPNNIIAFNPDILASEYKLLSVAFHEFSHAHDSRIGLISYSAYVPTTTTIQKYMGRGYFIIEGKEDIFYLKEEIRRSEIRAYERQLNFLETLRNKNWGDKTSFESYREFLLDNLRRYKNGEDVFKIAFPF